MDSKRRHRCAPAKWANPNSNPGPPLSRFYSLHALLNVTPGINSKAWLPPCLFVGNQPANETDDFVLSGNQFIVMLALRLRRPALLLVQHLNPGERVFSAFDLLVPSRLIEIVKWAVDKNVASSPVDREIIRVGKGVGSEYAKCIMALEHVFPVRLIMQNTFEKLKLTPLLVLLSRRGSAQKLHLSAQAARNPTLKAALLGDVTAGSLRS